MFTETKPSQYRNKRVYDLKGDRKLKVKILALSAACAFVMLVIGQLLVSIVNFFDASSVGYLIAKTVFTLIFTAVGCLACDSTSFEMLRRMKHQKIDFSLDYRKNYYKYFFAAADGYFSPKGFALYRLFGPAIITAIAILAYITFPKEMFWVVYPAATACLSGSVGYIYILLKLSSKDVLIEDSKKTVTVWFE